MSERITAAEAVYHRRALAQLRAAQSVWESWSSHLATSYNLSPGDDVDESGAILRRVDDEGKLRADAVGTDVSD